MICELAEVVFKDSIFKYGKKVSKQKIETVIRTKFAPNFCLWQNWKRKFFEKQNLIFIYGESISITRV